MRKVLGSLFALGLLAAQAETIVFYDFADGGAVKYSDDVPGMAG